MKRLLLFILLVMMLVWLARIHHYQVHNAPQFGPVDTRLWAANQAHHAALCAAQEAHCAAWEARTKTHQAIVETRDQFRESLDEANEELQEAAEEVREAVDGIPVPIVPGTRVVEALPRPPARPGILPVEAPARPPLPPRPPGRLNSPGFPGLVDHPQAPPLPLPRPDTSRRLRFAHKKRGSLPA